MAHDDARAGSAQAKDGCRTCPIAPRDAGITDRREFLRGALMVAASLGLVATGARDAFALPAAMRALPRLAHQRSGEHRYPVPATDSVTIDHEESVIIARAAGKAYAFSLSCPHQNTALRWEAADNEFRCPKHKSRYRPDGAFIDGRATRAMDRLTIRREGDALVVDVDAVIQQDEHPAQWTAAFVALA